MGEIVDLEKEFPKTEAEQVTRDECIKYFLNILGASTHPEPEYQLRPELKAILQKTVSLLWKDGERERVEKTVSPLWKDGERERVEVTSHSERDILKNCIGLMHEITGYVEEWLDWIGVKKEDYSKDEEWFNLNLTYFHIVQRLFLWNTNHSGGTSTGQKCKELLVSESDSVTFTVWDEDETEE